MKKKPNFVEVKIKIKGLFSVTESKYIFNELMKQANFIHKRVIKFRKKARLEEEMGKL